MSLACLVCHGMDSPSHTSRSYSISSSDNDRRCSVLANCLTRKAPLPSTTAPRTAGPPSKAKVTPHPAIPNTSADAASRMPGPPRLVRSHAVTRDLVRDWNFDEVAVVSH